MRQVTWQYFCKMHKCTPDERRRLALFLVVHRMAELHKTLLKEVGLK